MKASPVLSTGIKVLLCDFCNQPVSSAIPADAMLRVSVLMCPECLARIPETLANKFLSSASWPLSSESSSSLDISGKR